MPFSDIPTSLVPFPQTEHGRLRRKERGIDRKDLQAALKHGKREKCLFKSRNGKRTWKYVLGDITYVVEQGTFEEVTSFAKPIRLAPVPISNQLRAEIDVYKRRVKSSPSEWKSNTVIVVDTSGSMREADMWGTRTRLSAVWLSVALDYIAHRLEAGEACGFDVVSIVTLCEEPQVLIRDRPWTWALYNEVVDFYNQPLRYKPVGHGPFLPALEKAHQLLTRNSASSCAISLCFLSDGRPSDQIRSTPVGETVQGLINTKIEDLAKRFGRRLSFYAIGIGDLDNFNTLESMVDTAKDYGVKAFFQLPSNTSSDLGSVFTSAATSLSTSQTEMTDVRTMRQQAIREVLRESRRLAAIPISEVSEAEFFLYPLDNVTRTVYSEIIVDGRRSKTFETVSMINPDTRYVAFCKEVFGEGAERFAYRFYELAADRKTILGKPLVAKESRLVLDTEYTDTRARELFVKTFCETQQLARRIGEKFNRKLDKLRRVDPRTPRVKFLDCSIYKISDVNTGDQSVLVEERLDESLWFKWNCNNGYVEGMEAAPRYSNEQLRDAVSNLATLDAIAEGDSDEESEDNSEIDKPTAIVFSPSEVAQAFSHFSYIDSYRRRLVCDLQGVYDQDENVLLFSDPVIHYHHPDGEHLGDHRRNRYGRTDRGRAGIAMFFDTHHEFCGHLCRLVCRGFRKPRRYR